MSCSYADGLSPYENKGVVGLPEKFDSPEESERKVRILAGYIRESKHVVVHTGAGISTSAGIPDFRGPKGVWTLEEKGIKPDMNVSFNDAKPTITHMALVALQKAGYIQYVISQNIDGLHLKSGFPRNKLAELHGNIFIEQCKYCNRQFVCSSTVPTVGQKCLGKPCPATRLGRRPCRGKLHDFVLDWEDDLPDKDLKMSDIHSCAADLSLCLGTTLQIVPSGNLPTYTKRRGGKLVICNLQPTKHDKKADVLIHTYVDDVMMLLLKYLNIELPEYLDTENPMNIAKLCEEGEGVNYVEWTLPDKLLEETRRTVIPKNVDKSQCKKRKSKSKNKTGEKKWKTSPDFMNGLCLPTGETNTEEMLNSASCHKAARSQTYNNENHPENSGEISKDVKQECDVANNEIITDIDHKNNIKEVTNNQNLTDSSCDESDINEIFTNLEKTSKIKPTSNY